MYREGGGLTSDIGRGGYREQHGEGADEAGRCYPGAVQVWQPVLGRGRAAGTFFALFLEGGLCLIGVGIGRVLWY